MIRTVLLTLMALNTGGAETHAISLAKEMKKQKINVLVASNGGCMVRELDEAGIPHFNVPLNNKTPWDILHSYKTLGEICRKQSVDLIHAHARIPAWVSTQLGKKLKIPVVTTSHGIYSTRWGMRQLTVWGDHVIAVSQDIKEHLIKNFGVKTDKITVIQNGIDTDKFIPLQGENSLKPQGKKPVILYISRLEGARGEIALKLLDAIPKLSAKFKDILCIIVGEGDKMHIIQEKAKRINISRETVRITGARQDINNIIHMGDIVVGVGRVALEGMACGKPVIVAGEAGFMGILTPDNLAIAKTHNFSGRGCSDKTDGDKLSQAILTLMADDQVRKELGEFGRKVVLENYSIKSMTESIINVYHNVKIKHKV